MVHGACSSSGCYALTDEGVAEIFAVARDALRGGQRVFQVQAFPFRMTPQNMAKNRNDPNYAFWQNLKVGHDLFDVTRQPPQVGYCGRDYAFAAAGAQGMPSEPLAECPPAFMTKDPLVAARQQDDERMVEQLLSTGTALRAHAYSDGGMHPLFRSQLERRGAQVLAKTTSLSSVPVSRRMRLFADPHDPRPSSDEAGSKRVFAPEMGHSHDEIAGVRTPVSSFHWSSASGRSESLQRPVDRSVRHDLRRDRVSGDTGDGDGPVPAKQDHASPCQDHCKTIMPDIDGMTRSPDRQFSLLAEVDPAPVDPGAVSPPPQ
jgi:hypothetical protein